MYPTLLVILVNLTNSHVEYTLRSTGLPVQGVDEILHRRTPARRLEDLSTIDILPESQFGPELGVILVGIDKNPNGVINDSSIKDLTGGDKC
jgi:hypothetical protein